jgi:hypothetical protein
MEKVKISKDGASIDFVQSETLANPKKFRSSVEVESFYRFVNDNDLRKEALEIIERILSARKVEKAAQKAATRLAAKAAKTPTK